MIVLNLFVLFNPVRPAAVSDFADLSPELNATRLSGGEGLGEHIVAGKL